MRLQSFAAPGLMALLLLACEGLDVEQAAQAFSTSSSSGTGGYGAGYCAYDHSDSSMGGAPVDYNLGGGGQNNIGSGGFGGSGGAGGWDVKSDTIIDEIIDTPASQLYFVAQRHALKFRNCVETIVEVEAMPGQLSAAQQAVTYAGGTVTHIWSGADKLQAWVPAGGLSSLRTSGTVAMLRYPAQGSDDAAATIRADTWHGAGETGANARIGVIDSGFEDLDNIFPIPLPATVTGQSFVDGEGFQEGGNHGTATAGAAQVIAPGASFFLARAVTPAEVEDATAWLRSQNVDVINMSRSFYGESPGDGTGGFRAFIQAARNDGVLWVNSAGNARLGHLGMAFADVDADGFVDIPGTGVELLGIGTPGTNNFTIIRAGDRIVGALRWSDWTNVNRDFQLQLRRRLIVETPTGFAWAAGSSWDIATESSDPQTGGAGQRPTERIRFTADVPLAAYAFAIVRPPGPSGPLSGIHLDLFVDDYNLQDATTANSITHPSDLPEVTSVGAVEFSAPHAIVDSSGEGPTLGPGGMATGGALKPDITAIHDVPINGFGGTFTGTSAAAPHVAGAVALMRSGDPNLTPAQLEVRLDEMSFDQGPAGHDNRFGVGRLLMDVPVSIAALVGPLIATAGGTYSYDALVAPGNATTPVNYLWTASDHSPFSTTGGLSSNASFTWNTTGTKTIQIQASNTEVAPATITLTLDVHQLTANPFPLFNDCSAAPGTQWTMQVALGGTTSASQYGLYFSSSLQHWYAIEDLVAGQDSSMTWLECGGGPGRVYYANTMFFRAGVADDPDGDGLDTSLELLQTGTDPHMADSDGDGTPDGAEDPDGDGIDSVTERNLNGADPCRHGASHANLPDSDFDGVNDDVDQFPLDPAAWLDSDCDGQSNLPLNGASTSFPPVTED